MTDEEFFKLIAYLLPAVVTGMVGLLFFQVTHQDEEEETIPCTKTVKKILAH